MTPDDGKPKIPPALQPVVECLRALRPRATGHELDRAKLRAIAQATRNDSARARRIGSGVIMGSRRAISLALAIGLITGGTAVYATSGGPRSASSKESAAKSQYCPTDDDEKGRRSRSRDDDARGSEGEATAQPSHFGKLKKPGPAKCGKGDDDDDDDDDDDREDPRRGRDDGKHKGKKDDDDGKQNGNKSKDSGGKQNGNKSKDSGGKQNGKKSKDGGGKQKGKKGDD